MDLVRSRTAAAAAAITMSTTRTSLTSTKTTTSKMDVGRLRKTTPRNRSVKKKVLACNFNVITNNEI